MPQVSAMDSRALVRGPKVKSNDEVAALERPGEGSQHEEHRRVDDPRLTAEPISQNPPQSCCSSPAPSLSHSMPICYAISLPDGPKNRSLQTNTGPSAVRGVVDRLCSNTLGTQCETAELVDDGLEKVEVEAVVVGEFGTSGTTGGGYA